MRRVVQVGTVVADVAQAVGVGIQQRWVRVIGAVVDGLADRVAIAIVERIGDSLRLSKTAAVEPELHWSDAGNGREYEVQRCEPPLGGSCDPAGLTIVGPYQGDWIDPAATGPRLLWYRVSETGACVP